MPCTSIREVFFNRLKVLDRYRSRLICQGGTWSPQPLFLIVPHLRSFRATVLASRSNEWVVVNLYSWHYISIQVFLTPGHQPSGLRRHCADGDRVKYLPRGGAAPRLFHHSTQTGLDHHGEGQCHKDVSFTVWGNEECSDKSKTADLESAIAVLVHSWCISLSLLIYSLIFLTVWHFICGCSGLPARLPLQQPLLQIPERPHQLSAGRWVCARHHSRSARPSRQQPLQFKLQRGPSDAGDAPICKPRCQALWGCSSFCWHLDLPTLLIKGCDHSYCFFDFKNIPSDAFSLQQGTRKAAVKILKNFDEAITVDIASLDPEQLYQRPYAGWVVDEVEAESQIYV